MNGWQQLSEIPNGSIFETREGVRAVKSEYRYSNEYPAIQVVLLANGEYGHFAQHIQDRAEAARAHNSTAVRIINDPGGVVEAATAVMRTLGSRDGLQFMHRDSLLRAQWKELRQELEAIGAKYRAEDRER